MIRHYHFLVISFAFFLHKMIAQILNETEPEAESTDHVMQYSNNSAEYQYSNDSVEYQNSNESIFPEVMNLSPKEKRRRLLEKLITTMVGTDEKKVKILTDPEHPYINATTGQCFNHVITSFSKACINSTAFGGWRTFKGYFAVACKALGMKRQRITECINRVCKRFPYLKI